MNGATSAAFAVRLLAIREVALVRRVVGIFA